MKSIAALFAVTTLFAAPVFAAGGHHGSHGHKMSPEMKAKHDALEAKMVDTSAFGLKGDPKKATRTVTLNAADISFDVKSLDLKSGETVKFVLVNKGELPHELTIGDASYQTHAREMMTMMTEMGMDPASPEHAQMHAGAGNTVVAQPGETKILAWTFSKPGNFVYSCNMIGHAEAGMSGTISVK